MTRPRQIALCFLLLMGAATHGQTWEPVAPHVAADAYNTAAAKYTGQQKYRMGVEVASYRDQADKEPDQVVACDIRRAGDLYRADHFGRVSYQDARMKVMVVPEQHTVVLGAGQEAFDMLGAEIRKEMFTSAVKATQFTDPGAARYRVYLSKAYKWEYLEFAFDPQGWMRQLTLVLAEPMAVDPGNPLTALVRPRIVFSFEVPRSLDLPTDDLSWSNVLALRGTSAEAIGPYAGYEVIDTRPR